MRINLWRMISIVAALLVMNAVTFAHAQQRSWTPEDSIPIRYFMGANGAWRNWVAAPEAAAHFSPDKRRFFFVTRRGDLGCDCNIYELYIYASDDVAARLADPHSATEAELRPLRAINRRATSNSSAISQPQWQGNDTIVFAGAQDEGPVQLYQLRVSDGSLTQLSREHGVQRFWVNANSIIYFAENGADALPSLDAYPMVELTPEALGRALAGGVEALPRFAAYASTAGAQGRELTPVETPLRQSSIWISPNGATAIGLLGVSADSAPASWARYDAPQQARLRFVRLDLALATATPVFDAPSGLATPMGRAAATREQSPLPPDAVWSRDGQFVVLVNTAVPLSASEAGSDSAYVAAYDVAAQHWQIIEPLIRSEQSVTGVRIGQQGAILVDHASANSRVVSTTVYRRRGERWQRDPSPMNSNADDAIEPPPDPFTLSIEEDANTPPSLVATRGSEHLTITRPDPALARLSRARATTITWTEPDGRSVSGLLMLPPTARTAPPPLVIQSYYYLPNLFRPDGAFSSPYAAQALSARGMAVLQIDIPAVDRVNTLGTLEELQAFVTRVDAAVSELARRHLIDPTRVGLIGHSRAGYMTYYAITHPGSTPIAAAVSGDGFIGSLGHYLLYGINDRHPEWWENVNGGKPFWDEPSAWLAGVPEFNMQRVRAPFLFLANHPTAALWFGETAGAFRLNRIPFELINFPQGTHPLARPRERLAAMTETVDWMAFWLLGNEDHAQAKTARYARWRIMRDERRSRQADADILSR